MLPVECLHHANPFDCKNAESDNTSNIVTQNIVLVDTRYGEYASCNIVAGKYHCSCPSGKCATSVGRVDVKERELSHPRPRQGAEAWSWWRLNLAVKMGTPTSGYWFSTLSSGNCLESNATDCTWKLQQTTRRIVAKCLENRITDALRKANPSCFSDCPQPSNSSSTCVVNCYMNTMLGEEGGTRLIKDGEGIPSQLIVDAWETAFKSIDPETGGCPDAPSALHSAV